ncbi:MAG: hypothetical protein ACTSR3_04190 [Candidatus Helarchaeota archaeon]
MSNSEEQLRNRLKIIHNKTLCEILKYFNKDPDKELSIEELKNELAINTSSLFNSLKKLRSFGYIHQVARGHYKINYIQGDSLRIILSQLEENKISKKIENQNIDSHLSLIRHYKNPDLIFPELISTYRSIKISNLVRSGVSRATAFRVLKELTTLGFLIKNEKEKSWKSTSELDRLRNVFFQEWSEFPGNVKEIIKTLKDVLPDTVEYGGTVVGTIAGFPIYTDYIEDKINEFTAMVSAQINIAIKQCSATNHKLNFFVNFTEKGLIIAYLFKKISLAFILHTEKKFELFPKLIEILNEKAKLIKNKSDKLKIGF